MVHSATNNVLVTMRSWAPKRVALGQDGISCIWPLFVSAGSCHPPVLISERASQGKVAANMQKWTPCLAWVASVLLSSMTHVACHNLGRYFSAAAEPYCRDSSCHRVWLHDFQCARTALPRTPASHLSLCLMSHVRMHVSSWGVMLSAAKEPSRREGGCHRH